MRIQKLVAGTLATAALTGAIVLAAPPSSGPPTSLAEVLTSDGDTFDLDWNDYDIVTEAVLAVLAAKPASPVGLLTDGTVSLTAFIPDDRSFQRLVADLTGRWYLFSPDREQLTFNALVAAAGTLGDPIDVIETVLLYHVVPGATIDSATALFVPPGTMLTTAQGSPITVFPFPMFRTAVLVDQDGDDRDPRLIGSQLDINLGNPQIAHGIRFVLRPLDL